jgi:LEA14-like dessication related protein
MKNKIFTFSGRGAVSVLLVTVLVGLAAACASLSSLFKEPALSLKSVDIAGIDFTGADLVCHVNVDNPNSFTIPFPRIDWEFFINANSFVSGAVSNSESIKARQTTVVDVPVSVTWEGLYNTFRSLRDTEEADFRVDMAATFDIPVIGDKTWNFTAGGKLPVLRPPKISAPSFRIGAIDFSGVELVFSVKVENPNKFDLPFPEMEYSYAVNKNSFVKSSVAGAAVLAAASVTPVDITLGLAYADLYQAFQSLLGSSEASGLLTLNSVFPVPALADEKSLLEIPGNIPLLKPPALAFQGIGVKNISLSRLELELTLEVENRNGFAMKVEELAYSLAVNNTPWARSQVPAGTVLGPNRKTLVPVTFSVDSLAMVSELTGLITRGAEVAYTCGGSMKLGSDFPGLKPLDLPFNLSGNTRLRR